MHFPLTISEPYNFNGNSIVGVNDGTTTWNVTDEMREELPKIYNMELRNDDVWLLGGPKSGNTWSSEMLYVVYLGIDKAKQKDHLDRVNGIEVSAYERMGVKKLPEEKRKHIVIKDYFKQTVECESPRVIRCHLPITLLPPNLLDTCKVVYICRNLKDVVLSYFKMATGTGLLTADKIELFVDMFMSERGMHQPACEQIKQAWEKRHHPNMYFLFYEDMKRDLPGMLRKIGTFLGKSLTDEQVKDLENYLSVENMRKNKTMDFNKDIQEKGLMGKETQFIRKGITGDWKNHFTPAMNEKFDRWVSSKFAGTDFKFKE